MTITLYNINGSPPCNFVRTLAKHLDIDVKLKNLDYSHKEQFSDEYLKISPFLKAPAIDDEGFVLYESNAIAYYLLRKYAPDSELYPACIKTRTHIDQILSSLVTTIHSQTAVFVNKFVDPSKFPKLASYYDRVKRKQPYFEEIYKPVIYSIEQLFDSLK
ncbi:glutathione S-transferase 1-1-like [Dermacentor andersoni]|uniref:glutathione S-transferase 1-1-like n=1 Tax=Dermacentor andersoni TaxID=34620 RepID=UPI003B3A44AB